MIRWLQRFALAIQIDGQQRVLEMQLPWGYRRRVWAALFNTTAKREALR